MTRTLTRADLIDSLTRIVSLPRQDAVDVLEGTLSILTKTLKKDGVMKISSFGSFSVQKKAKRIGRNPKTGEEAIIAPRNVLSFRPSQHLKDKIAQGLST